MKTKILLKIVPALFMVAGWNISLQAQTIKVPVKKKVVNQVNTRANNDVDKALDKGFDKIEKGIGGLFKKKHKKKGKHSHTEASTASAAASNSPTVANSTNQRFQGLNRNAIANLNNEMVNQPGYLTGHNGVVAGKGSVFVYKTSEGNYGKLEIIDIDKNANYKTTFRYVTYANEWKHS